MPGVAAVTTTGGLICIGLLSKVFSSKSERFNLLRVETPRRVNADVGRESASVETHRETHFLLAGQHVALKNTVAIGRPGSTDAFFRFESWELVLYIEPGHVCWNQSNQ